MDNSRVSYDDSLFAANALLPAHGGPQVRTPSANRARGKQKHKPPVLVCPDAVT